MTEEETPQIPHKVTRVGDKLIVIPDSGGQEVYRAGKGEAPTYDFLQLSNKTDLERQKFPGTDEEYNQLRHRMWELEYMLNLEKPGEKVNLPERKLLAQELKELKQQLGRRTGLLPTEARASASEAVNLATEKKLLDRSSATGQPKSGAQTETSISGRK